MYGLSLWPDAMLYLASRLKCIELNLQISTSAVPFVLRETVVAGFNPDSTFRKSRST